MPSSVAKTIAATVLLIPFVTSSATTGTGNVHAVMAQRYNGPTAAELESIELLIGIHPSNIGDAEGGMPTTGGAIPTEAFKEDTPILLTQPIAPAVPEDDIIVAQQSTSQKGDSTNNVVSVVATDAAIPLVTSEPWFVLTEHVKTDGELTVAPPSTIASESSTRFTTRVDIYQSAGLDGTRVVGLSSVSPQATLMAAAVMVFAAMTSLLL